MGPKEGVIVIDSLLTVSIGETDSDGCDWYLGNEEWCGTYDDDDFYASEYCCQCQSSDVYWTSLKADIGTSRSYTSGFMAFAAVCLIAVGLSYAHSKKRVNYDDTFLRSNVSERLI